MSSERIALTRQVPDSLAACELTHLEREPIDVERARGEHDAYEELLSDLGCRVQRVESTPHLADSVFVEDTAVVLDEVAVLTRPGAESRRPEVASVASALEPYRELIELEAPATLDGGDVLQVGKQLFVGLSRRSNPAGVEALQRAVRPFGYRVQGVELRGCLHLKSAVVRVAEDTLLAYRPWIDTAPFEGLCIVDVDPREERGANALALNGTLVYPAGCPRTLRRLVELGLDVRTIEVGELAKAEAGVTCCSIVFEA